MVMVVDVAALLVLKLVVVGKDDRTGLAVGGAESMCKGGWEKRWGQERWGQEIMDRGVNVEEGGRGLGWAWGRVVTNVYKR
jgi:hypothetical protein